MPNPEIMDKYEKVKTSLETAVKSAESIELTDSEESAELAYIKNTLSLLNEDFKSEVDKLQNSSEWDRFCMAFFGETNAGKSTIIDALRIIYDEEKRREEIENQAEQFQNELNKEEEQYLGLIDSIKQVNESLVISKRKRTIEIIKSIGLILIGVAIGFVATYFALIRR